MKKEQCICWIIPPHWTSLMESLSHGASVATSQPQRLQNYPGRTYHLPHSKGWFQFLLHWNFQSSHFNQFNLPQANHLCIPFLQMQILWPSDLLISSEMTLKILGKRKLVQWWQWMATHGGWISSGAGPQTWSEVCTSNLNSVPLFPHPVLPQ